MRALQRPAIRPRPPRPPGATNAAPPAAPGNQQLQRAARLVVGRADDALEREADDIAARVLAPGGAGVAAISAASGQVQRACSSCADDAVQRVQAQRDAAPAAGMPVANPLRRAGGQPLPAALRHELEPRFGRDFAQVRIHDYPQALVASRQLGARAFTLGDDIAFAPGQFAPYSEAGRRLLAHELTHVVQQSGGRRADGVRPAVQAVAPRVQADGGVTDADLDLMRRWLAAEMDPQRPGYQPLLPLHRPFGAAPPGGFQPGGVAEDPALRLQARAAASGDCPGSCHSVNEGLKRQAAARAEQARRQEREAAWRAMVPEQARADLAQQAGTLEEDIQTSELAAGSLRVQLFERALQAPARPAGTFLLPAASAVVSEAMRSGWMAAQQATIVLEALLRASTDPPPDAVVAPLREAYRNYYGSLDEALRTLDAEEQRRALALPEIRPISTCPSGACHGRTDPLPRSTLAGDEPVVPQHTAVDLRALLIDRRGTPPQSSLPEGERSRRLREATAAAGAAATHAQWQGVIGDFRWATARLDEILRAQLQEIGGSCDLIAQFDFNQQLLERQRTFQRAQPKALKVRAVFYPEHDIERRADEQGVQREVAKAIPWQFYLVRTEVPDPRSRNVPGDYEWQLHDITAPIRKDGRTVRTRTAVGGDLNALARERYDPQPITQMDPPDALFDQLNHRDFFPKGVLHWQSPITGNEFHKTMTAPKPFGEWLTDIGMALVIVGSLVFAPMSTPMLISVALGTGLSIAGRAHRLHEMEEHGVQRPGDVERFYWDVGLDIVSALTLGLGKAVQVGRAASVTMRAAAGIERAYFIARRAQIALDVINIGVVTHDFVQQYRAIQDSNMSPDEKGAALAQLTMFAFGTGALMIVPLRSGLHEIGRRPALRLSPDPAKPGALVADLEASAVGEAAGHLRTRPQADAHIVSRTQFTHPETGELHHYALWSDGRITRCSPPPCLQLAESVVGRLEDLSDRMIGGSRYAATLQDLAGRARQLREEAERLAAGPAAKLRESEEAVMQATRDIESRMVRLERGIAEENRAVERSGRKEAEARWGAPALDYDERYYRWVRRLDGTLEFQRRHQAVPWLRFDPASRSFVVERSLFVGVSDARLQQLRETSATKDLRIVRTIDSVDELRRLRPASETRKRPPEDWVLVRIDDRNLVQFYDEAIPHGTIFEFPDGSRVWRTPRNTIMSEGAVRPPIGRRGFEQSTPAQLRTDTGGRTNEGVPLEQTGVEHQRAHPRGQGTGFEMFNHIPLAPTYVNQQLQARGIELYIAKLKEAHPDLDLRLITEHEVFPRTRRQAWIDYRLEVVRNGQRQPLMTLRIGTDYSDPLKPAQVEMRWLTRNEADLALLMSVDMDVARAQLEARIREARRRR